MPPAPSSPQISVLVPAFNEEALLARTLATVRASFAAIEPIGHEVVVCDNNSTDRTAQIAAENGARVVFEPHNQIARARNAAARAAKGEWFIFLDADTFLNAEILSKTIACFRSGKIAGGGCVLKFDREVTRGFAAATTKLWNWISRKFALAAGSYLFCLRDAWRETGGFDENLYASEELAFSKKLKRWARQHGMRFVVLDGTPITTSGRKLDWYGDRELLLILLSLMWPGALKRRERCGLWYDRPADAVKKPSP